MRLWPLGRKSTASFYTEKVMDQGEKQIDAGEQLWKKLFPDVPFDSIPAPGAEIKQKPRSKKQKSKRDNVVTARKLQTLAKRLKTDAAFLDTLAQGLLRASQED
jgi:hypothetical protein